MTLNDAQKTIIVLMAVLLIMLTSFYVYDAMAQQQTTTTTAAAQPQSQQPQQQVEEGGSIGTGELATIVGGGTATGIVAIAKSILDQRKNAKRDRTTDGDAGYMFALISKWVQLKGLYPHMTDKEILDLPLTNNPYSKMTLGQAITSEGDKWVQGNQAYWGIPMPVMSVPTATTVEAVKGPNAVVSPAATSSTNNPQVAPSTTTTPNKQGSTAPQPANATNTTQQGAK